MRKSSILVLKKINKSEKNRAHYDISNKNSELNQEMSILEVRKKSLENELLLNSNYSEESIMINYSSNWHNSLLKQISAQQNTVTNLLNSIQLSNLDMKEIIKRSLLYNNLS